MVNKMLKVAEIIFSKELQWFSEFALVTFIQKDGNKNIYIFFIVKPKHRNAHTHTHTHTHTHRHTLISYQ